MKPLAIPVLSCAVIQGCTYSREPVGSDPARIDPAAWVPAAAETRDADHFDVILGPLAAEHIDLFTSEAHGVLMVWDQPVFLRPVAR